MAIFSIPQRTTVAANAAAAWEIRSAATNKPKIMELGISLSAATASIYGLGRPAAIGVNPTTPLTVLDESDGNGPTGNTQTAVAWAAGPTAPTNFLRRVALPATLGAGVILTFPRGLSLPISGSVVLWNLQANSASTELWVVVDE